MASTAFDIGEKFNKYFSNVASNLKSKIVGKNLYFVQALAQTISKSLKEWVLPLPLKLAKVEPIHDGGSNADYLPVVQYHSW